MAFSVKFFLARENIAPLKCAGRLELAVVRASEKAVQAD